jgi:hypothetical protein
MEANVKFPSNFVVRQAAPLRNIILITIGVLASALALYVIYELGRYDGGYDRLAAAQQRSELRVNIEKLEATNSQLRTQLAALETQRIGRTQERSALAQSIGELQARVAQQTQELAFYRDVISQRVGTKPDGESGFKVEQLQIKPVDPPDHFRVHLVLLRVVHPETPVSGTYTLNLEGQEGGKPQTVDFASLTGGRAHDQPFNFHYFGSLDQDITLPTGFRPERLTMQVQAGHTPDALLTQSFPWSVDAP